MIGGHRTSLWRWLGRRLGSMKEDEPQPLYSALVERHMDRDLSDGGGVCCEVDVSMDLETMRTPANFFCLCRGCGKKIVMRQVPTYREWCCLLCIERQLRNPVPRSLRTFLELR